MHYVTKPISMYDVPMYALSVLSHNYVDCVKYYLICTLNTVKVTYIIGSQQLQGRGR